MNLSAQLATGLLETLGNALWGFKPNLMRHIVEQHGAAQSITWFVRNMPKYESTLKQWGPIRTHLLAVEISVLNGCPYCTYGHAYALTLHYFKDRGTLMPVSEDEIVAWHSLGEAEAIACFHQLIESSDLPSEAPLLERMLVLRQGTEPPASSEDAKIVHLLEMFGFLNQCGIRGHVKLDQAHDPINKDTTLQHAYHRARSAALQPETTQSETTQQPTPQQAAT